MGRQMNYAIPLGNRPFVLWPQCSGTATVAVRTFAIVISLSSFLFRLGIRHRPAGRP